MFKVWKYREEIDVVNTIEYDGKSYRVKITMVKCTKVWLKVLKFNRSQKYMLVYPRIMLRIKKT